MVQRVLRDGRVATAVEKPTVEVRAAVPVEILDSGRQRRGLVLTSLSSVQRLAR